jgi:hypothetical protein
VNKAESVRPKRSVSRTVTASSSTPASSSAVGAAPSVSAADAPTADAPTPDRAGAPSTPANAMSAGDASPTSIGDAPSSAEDAPTTDAPTADAPTADAPTADAPTSDAPTPVLPAGAPSTPLTETSAGSSANEAPPVYVAIPQDYLRPYADGDNNRLPVCGACKPFSTYANKECEWSSDDNAYVIIASSTKFLTKDPTKLPLGWIWSRAIGPTKKRGAVRSHALTCLAMQGQVGPTADAPAGTKMHAAPFGKQFSHVSTIELSITVVTTKSDVPDDWLQGFGRFGEEHCDSYIAALERGEKQKNLHIQATAKIHARPEQIEVIKSFMVDYFTGFTATKNTKVQVKPLEGTQTFLAMIGYVLKVEGQPTNFAGFVCSDDITEDVRKEGKKEYHRMRPNILAGKVRFKT